MGTCLYLRKSREDVEKEKTGVDTLAAHQKTLLEFAKKNNITITEIKSEVVTGGGLYNRPQMVELLADIEEGKFDSVLCMDIDRLGRSGMKEQGIILETFQDNNVKIITIDKTYDLNNESDMLHTDIKSFMARQELNLIKHRLMAGRIRSTRDGNFVHGTAPFGYKKARINNCSTLEIIEEDAEIVKLIFDMYVNQDKGARIICDELKMLGIKNASNNTNWSTTTIKSMIHNQVYCGKVYFGKRVYKNNKNGSITTKTNPDFIIANGKHKPIITEELFKKAQEMAKSRYNPVVKKDASLVNPLAGVIKCGNCGYAMIIKKDYKAQRLNCSKICGSRGTNIIRVEKRIIEDLIGYFDDLTIELDALKRDKKDLIKLDKKNIIMTNIEKKQHQLNKLHDFLEQGIYDTDTFVKRNNMLSKEISQLKENIELIEKEVKEEETVDENIKAIPQIKNILDTYDTMSIEGKNIFLNSIINRIDYYKGKDAKPDEFKLVYDMKISR